MTAAQVRDDIDATQSRMHIAIIGSGHIGGGLGRAWANKGHAITFGVRDTSDPDLKPLLGETRAKAASIGEAARAAEVVVLAMPYGALDAVLDATGDLAGKVVIDCTNAVVPGMKLKYGFTTSSAEELQKRIPKAHVVKSFMRRAPRTSRTRLRRRAGVELLLRRRRGGARDRQAARRGRRLRAD